MDSLNYGNNWLNRIVRWVAAKRWPSAILAQLMHRMDPPLLRLSKGRYSVLRLLAGLPLITVNTIGAKSGQPRPVPLVGIPHNGALIVIASNFGRTHYPAWYYNLRANPQVDVIIQDQTIRCQARETEGEEYEQLWQIIVKMYIGYANYKTRAAHREIPVLLLEPIE